MHTYNISRLVDYEDFKALPHDLAAEYINSLRSTYNASREDIAKSMGLSSRALGCLLVDKAIPSPFKRGNQGKLDPRWPDFLGGKLTSKGVPIPTPEPEPEPEKTKPPMALVSKLLLEAGGTPSELLVLLTTAFADMTDLNLEYDIRVHITTKGAE